MRQYRKFSVDNSKGDCCMKRKYSKLILTFIILVTFLTSGMISITAETTEDKAPGVEWEKTYGGVALDVGIDVEQTKDGGYIVAGHSTSAGLTKIYLIKTKADGVKQWDNVFGDTQSYYTHAITQTKDGGYIITGHIFVKPGCMGLFLLKVDANGHEKWKKTLGKGSSNSGSDVQQTKDGGYIITGYFKVADASFYLTQLCLIKTDADGNMQWEKAYGETTGSSEGQSVMQTKDGDFIVTGFTNVLGSKKDLFLVKTGAYGDIIWEKTFGGLNDDSGYSIQQTTDGGYIVVGSTKSFGTGDNDTYLIKIDADGDKQWEKNFGGSYDDCGYSVQQTTDGSYIIYSGSSGRSITKVDTDGNQLWQKLLSVKGGYSVKQTADHGYIVTGHAGSDLNCDVSLIKIKPEVDGALTPIITSTNTSDDQSSARTLSAIAGNKMVTLNWNPIGNAVGLDGFYIYRSLSADGSNSSLANDFPIAATTFVDKNVDSGKTYYYTVKAVFSDAQGVKFYGVMSNIVPATPTQGKDIIVLVIGKTLMKVNGVDMEIDPGKNTTPVIVNGKTFVPIRAIIEIMGGTITYIAKEQKLIVELNGKTIEFWINSKTTKVNGVEKIADVAPFVSTTGRTMIPLRYVIENLSFDVVWDGPSQSITITFDSSTIKDRTVIVPIANMPNPTEGVPTAVSQKWIGSWNTDYGLMDFQLKDNKIRAEYGEGENINGKIVRNYIEGTIQVQDGVSILSGSWIEGSSKGYIKFILSIDGKSFDGKWWRLGEVERTAGDWDGTRE